MSGFSGASGVPKKYIDDLVAQSTADVTVTTPVTGVTVYENAFMATVVVDCSVTVTSIGWLDVSSGIPLAYNNSVVYFTCIRTDARKPILARCTIYGSFGLDVYETGTYTVRGSVTYFKKTT